MAVMTRSSRSANDSYFGERVAGRHLNCVAHMLNDRP
jgi:hypothetical protein